MPVSKPQFATIPFLTADLPGVGGVIKRYNEDFVVEEVPLYEACGEGTHVYFTIEKGGLTTLAAIRMIAHALGRKPHDIGYAGLKDAHAITRQTLSVEHVEPARIEALDLKQIRVLHVTRHRNKLKLGHLKGNRFVIKIRFPSETSPSDEARGAHRTGLTRAETRVCTGRGFIPTQGRAATSTRTVPRNQEELARGATGILETLARRGVPNYFGPQRFGTRGDNALVGRAVVYGDFHEAIALILGRPASDDRGDVRRARELFDANDWQGCADAWPRSSNEQRRLAIALVKAKSDARKAWRACDHTLRKLYGSALQSELFNQVLGARITGTLRDGSTFDISGIDGLALGDLAWLHRNGACFRVEDVERERPRCERLEISPSGPLFGRRMTEPTGRPSELEEAVLRLSGLERERIRSVDGTRLDGARRPLRVPLEDWDVQHGKDDRGLFIQLTFMLSPGAYATNVSREVCKPAHDLSFSLPWGILLNS